MSDVIQQEFFALPVAPRIVAKIDGVPLYGSKSLNFMFLMSLGKVQKTKAIKEELRDLVEKQIIVPCWLQRGVLKVRKFIINEKGAIRHIAGFYDPRSKKVYILIDNQINKWGFASNKVLSDLTVHECIHMFADRAPSKFFSIFKDDLKKFYYEYFNIVFDFGDKPVKEMDNITRFMFMGIERKVAGSGLTNSLLKRYHTYLDKNLRKYSNLKGKEFEKRLNDYIAVLKYYAKDISVFLNIRDKYTQILGPIQQAYRKTFGSTTDTIPIQELFLSSEIIAVSTEIKIRSSIYKAFK
jgi:hypothetical protein